MPFRPDGSSGFEQVPYRGGREPFGAPCEGSVLGVEVLLGADGQPDTDDNGNFIPTGLLRVLLLDRNEVRDHVPYCTSTAGNSVIDGGPPEVGAGCIVAFMARGRPVVIGFLTPGHANLATSRKTLPTLQPGELLRQSGKVSPDAQGTVRNFVGSRQWQDRYGRYRLEAADYELMIGYELIDEFGPDPQMVDDPIAQVPVFLRERVLSNERRVCRDGTVVDVVSGRRVETTGQDVLHDARGPYVVRGRQTVTVGDTKQNELTIHDDAVELRARSKVGLSSNGTLELDSGGDTILQALGALKAIAADEFTLDAAQGMTLSSAAKIVLQSMAGITLRGVGLADINLQSLGGNIDLFAKSVTMGPGIPTPVVPTGYDQAVLGQALLTVLTQVLQMLIRVGSGELVGTGSVASLAIVRDATALIGQLNLILSQTVKVST